MPLRSPLMSNTRYHRLPEQGETRAAECGSFIEDRHMEQYGTLRLYRPTHQHALIRRTSQHRLAASDVLTCVEDTLTSLFPPSFCIELKIFASSSSKQPDATLIIPLRGLTANSRTLYVRAEDAPCLRGGLSNTDNTTDRVLADLRQSWSLHCDGVSTVCPNGRVRLADSTTIERWNARVERNLCEPWKPLSERPARQTRHCDPRETPTYDMRQSWPDSSNRVRALQALQMFVEEDNAATKYLICPQSCYGWDLDYLSHLITMDLQHTANAGESSLTDAVLARFRESSTRVAKVTIKQKSPAFAIWRVRGKVSEQVSVIFPWMAYSEAPAIAIFAVAFPLMLLWSFILMGLLALNTAIWSFLPFALFACISVAAIVFACRLRSGAATVHEAVGVAWALKRWVALPSNLQISTAEDAMAAIPGASEARFIEKGWFVLIGSHEQEWWSENRIAILRAINDGRQGTLFLDEIYDPLAMSNSEYIPVGREDEIGPSTTSPERRGKHEQRGHLPSYDYVTLADEQSTEYPLLHQDQ